MAKMELLEREELLQDLQKFLAQASSGLGQLVFIAGEAGVGSGGHY